MTNNNQDFTTSILVEQTPQEVFDAINNVRGWWSGEIEGNPEKLGAEFTYRYSDIHRSTQKVTEFVPAEKIVWHVTDGYLSFVDKKDEWKGTDIIFEINEKDGKTELVFTHRGLVPLIACYLNCSDGWETLVQKNLRNFIITAKDQVDVFAGK
ncbi:MAG: ATPase [Candidatus Saccharibacteria bacterium]|nr:ATPase [Candidatus Saccharibacteria bacterium]